MKILFWLVFVINIVFAGYSGYNQYTASDSETVQDIKPLNADSIRLITPDAVAGKTADTQTGKAIYTGKSVVNHKKTL